MIVPPGNGSFPARKAVIATSLPRTAPKLFRLPASWAEEIHCQSRYPLGMSVTQGADCPSAWPGTGTMSARRPAVVANAIKKNVKRLMMVPPFQHASVNEISICLKADVEASSKPVWSPSSRFGRSRAQSSPAIRHHTRSADAKQLDDSIGETFVSVDFANAR